LKGVIDFSVTSFFVLRQGSKTSRFPSGAAG